MASPFSPVRALLVAAGFFAMVASALSGYHTVADDIRELLSAEVEAERSMWDCQLVASTKH
ncbi:hypothetical protein FB45DRAFT_1043921 [Roridomyces roridus]|uniref:Nematode cuticle collagen N-terminal domain-containing protein n=1 Tax=Roridomyces roridus TaxID=1738132 RepID=A0AAD7AYH1_9AGAR|nr:hypothetical protein FB45DRAFT_1043921 [Roridomyces roridus]